MKIFFTIASVILFLSNFGMAEKKPGTIHLLCGSNQVLIEPELIYYSEYEGPGPQYQYTGHYTATVSGNFEGNSFSVYLFSQNNEFSLLLNSDQGTYSFKSLSSKLNIEEPYCTPIKL